MEKTTPCPHVRSHSLHPHALPLSHFPPRIGNHLDWPAKGSLNSYSEFYVHAQQLPAIKLKCTMTFLCMPFPTVLSSRLSYAFLPATVLSFSCTFSDR
eukprot:c49098_g1_i1 orf=3-296(-)